MNAKLISAPFGNVVLLIAPAVLFAVVFVLIGGVSVGVTLAVSRRLTANFAAFAYCPAGNCFKNASKLALFVPFLIAFHQTCSYFCFACAA